MVQVFKSFIKKENLFMPKEKILLAVSGGIDSMLMCELFHLCGFNFGIAHCNFKLRASESDKDEEFVKSIAKKYKVNFHVTNFETSTFAKNNKLSTQIAARQLRYKWFEEIKDTYNYQFIATAHHKNDSIETVLINLIRGTGISGLHGILPKQGTIIRPMLFATKKEILKFVAAKKIKFREDQSNASSKYVRNKIRQQIIPILKEINPSLEKTFEENLKHIRDVERIFNTEIEKQRSIVVHSAAKNLSGEIKISISLLKNLRPIAAYLYEFLKPFNFNSTSVEKIISSLDNESGKQFASNTHLLVKDRDFLLIEKIKENQKSPINNSEYPIPKNRKYLNEDGLKLKFEKINSTSIIKNSKAEVQVDFDKLTFPLKIRKWEKGDSFSPLGMKGKKKLSDFFIDQKVTILQKKKVWLLTSNNEIVWIIGMRLDDRFKVTEKTKTTFTIKIR